MFAWPFEGDYWIFRLDEDYRWAAVGSPDRRSLWILSRTAVMQQDTYDRLVASLEADGFDPGKLVVTRQRPVVPQPTGRTGP
jgi:apolipoprotein D and lipocalin family protein